MKPRSLTKLQLIAIYVLSVMIVFNYLPLVSFGTLAGLHLDGSLLYAVLVMFAIVQLPAIYRERRVIANHPASYLLVGFVTFQALSVFWSDNLPRALFTAGFSMLLVVTALGVAAQRKLIIAHKQMVLTFIGSAFLLTGLFALWQIIGDSLGMPAHVTLLPTNYTSGVFGVARPTGFSLEPQFFGSLLLLPFSYFLYQTLKQATSLISPNSIGLFCSATLLFLTISRGALLAAAATSMLLFFIVKTHQHQTHARVNSAGILSLAIIAGLLLQCVAGSLNIRDEKNGIATINAVISQLSLGKISLSRTEPVSAPAIPQAASKQAPTTQNSSYIASSSDSRLSMSRAALELWLHSPLTTLFGIGIGSFGASLHVRNPSIPIGSVANNFYLELLAETGIVGVGLFAAFILSVLVGLIARRQWFFVALLAGYLLQWSFFSGSGNVVHVWLLLGWCLGLLLYSQPEAAKHLV